MRPEMNSSRDETHPGMRYRSVYMVPEMSKYNDLCDVKFDVLVRFLLFEQCNDVKP